MCYFLHEKPVFRKQSCHCFFKLVLLNQLVIHFFSYCRIKYNLPAMVALARVVSTLPDIKGRTHSPKIFFTHAENEKNNYRALIDYSFLLSLFDSTNFSRHYDQKSV